MDVWMDVLKVIPLIWCSVIALVLITYKPAELMTGKLVKEGDCFNAHIIVNTLCTVLLISIFMMVVATWSGSRNVSIELIRTFFYKWPRNFAISFAIEALAAHPIARTVLFKLHQIKDAKDNSELVAKRDKNVCI